MRAWNEEPTRCSIWVMPCCVKARRSRCRNCRCRPLFERQWPSVYEALEDGRTNVEQMRAIWVSVLLADRAEHEAIWIAVDGSNIARPMRRPARIAR